MKLIVAAWLVVLPPALADDMTTDRDDSVTIAGQIVSNDVRDRVRKHPCKIHLLKLSKDKVYVIDMISTNFDAYLRLEDSAGRQLAEDDDSGGNLNARIRFAPPRDDSYQIIATSYAGGAGTYTLKIARAAK